MSQRRKRLRRLLFLLAAGVFLYAGFRLVSTLREEAASRAAAEELIELAVTSAPDSPEEAAPIQVDFDALRGENEEIAAWLYCPDTPINYPVYHAGDNDKYLRHLPDGQWNIAGSLFLDYRSAVDFSHGNSVIYGHNMKNKTMFGSLPSYREQSYYDAHPVLYLLTPGQDYRVELLSGFVTATDSPVYNLPLEGDASAVAELCAAQSDFASGAEVQPGDRLLTLSTCSYEYQNARYVLVGVLRAMEG